ncbi:MAG: NAD(P)-binding domain-containing protein [Bacteroidetes bacterium]|nr:NAD(P)-binding domain-containing protein [Bacteroidota bacterium]
MKIAILGAGNGGQAMAGHFSLLGHQVSLYNRNLDKLKVLVAKKSITIEDAIVGESKINLITENIAAAIADAELIMVTTTANAHREIAKMISPFIENGQTIVLNPGRTLGALEFSHELKKHTSKKIYIAEAQSLIYACRTITPGVVKIFGVKDKVLLSAYPAIYTDFVLKKLNSVYNCFLSAENILSTGLENIGAIFHPTVVLFNAAAIERGSMFYFYNDMTPSVANFIEEIDKERIAIGNAFGIKLRTVSEWISFAYKGIEGNSLCDKMRNNPAYYKILAPNTLHSRLLSEDIPTGVLPFIELAMMAKLEVPLLRSIMFISEKLLNQDFRITGRTLCNLDIAHLTLPEFIKAL